MSSGKLLGVAAGASARAPQSSAGRCRQGRPRWRFGTRALVSSMKIADFLWPAFGGSPLVSKEPLQKPAPSDLDIMSSGVDCRVWVGGNEAADAGAGGV